MSDYDEDYNDYGDDGDDSTASGSYSKEDWQMAVEVSGDDILIIKDGNNHVAKVPVKTFKTLLEKKLGRDLSSAEVAEELAKYTASIDAQASFTIGTHVDHYGADADGNRGVDRTEFNDEDPEVEIEQLDLRLVDEDGNVLGGEEFVVALEENCEGLEQLIIAEISADPAQYCD
jgi:hypothetical protein